MNRESIVGDYCSIESAVAFCCGYYQILHRIATVYTFRANQHTYEMDFPTASPAVLDALSDALRRAALRTLVDHQRTLSVDELAAAVGDGSPGAGGHTDSEGVQAVLYHAHLPLLAKAGAVTFNPETGLVGLAADSQFDREWVRQLVVDRPDPSYDETLSALASARRQAILYEVCQGGRLSEHDLAARVAAHERHQSAEAVPEAVRSVVDLSLTHTHIPMLTGPGLLDSDPVAGTVSPGDPAWQSDRWVAESPIAEWPTE